MSSQINQEIQDIRIANLEKDVAFYAAAVAMLERGWTRWLFYRPRKIYPEDAALDRQIRERMLKGELNPKALVYLNQINSQGMTYAESSRNGRAYDRWILVLGRTRNQLREAEETLKNAKAERGY
jgi:hypothetical protein